MHYRRAIDWFLALSKDERENRSRTRLYEKKVNSLLDRCEVLKRWNHNSNEIYRPVQASGDLLSGLLELMEDNTQSVDSLSSGIVSLSLLLTSYISNQLSMKQKKQFVMIILVHISLHCSITSKPSNSSRLQPNRKEMSSVLHCTQAKYAQ